VRIVLGREDAMAFTFGAIWRCVCVCVCMCVSVFVSACVCVCVCVCWGERMLTFGAIWRCVCDRERERE